MKIALGEKDSGCLGSVSNVFLWSLLWFVLISNFDSYEKHSKKKNHPKRAEWRTRQTLMISKVS